jgi:hypothetical protein
MAARKDSLERSAEDLEAYTKKVRNRTTKTVDQMAQMLKKEIKKTVGKKDGHDYNWMARNNHPYGKGPHPKGKARGKVPHKDPFVHVQSGELSKNVEIFKGKRKDEKEVGIDQDIVPYVGDVLFGTHKMIGRNFLSYSLLKMNKKFLKMIKNIGK